MISWNPRYICGIRQRRSSAVRVSASHTLGSQFKIPPGARIRLTYSKIAASAVLMSGVFREFGTSGLWIGKKVTWFRNNSVRHSCTAVMSNGVPLPTTVFEKVVKCWGYTLVRRMGTLNDGPGSRIRSEFTPMPRYPLNTHRKEKAWNKPVFIHDRNME